MFANEIRNHFLQGNVAKAFDLLSASAPSELRPRLHRLQNRLAVDPPALTGDLETHHRLLFDALHLVSMCEVREAGGQAAVRVREMARLESDLVKAYRYLARLNHYTLTDRFMRWLLQKHAPLFYELVQLERDAPIDLEQLFDGLELNAFCRSARLNTPAAEVRTRLLAHCRRRPRCFTAWLDTTAQRIRLRYKLLESIEQTRLHHERLMRAEPGEPCAGVASIGEVLTSYRAMKCGKT